MLWQTKKRFTPPFDVIEAEGTITILMEVAGMHVQDFNITLADRSLIVSGVRRRPEFDGAAYHRVEVGFGEFKLEIPLPWSVQRDQVSANYRNGFLYIDLPRLPEKHIPIVETHKQDTPDDQ